MKLEKQYEGFELGPIRPPSEANSLLLRVTRNCPWNKCKFCGLYKGKKFSVRPVEHVLKDIDTIKYYVDHIIDIRKLASGNASEDLIAFHDQQPERDPMVFHAALSWIQGGMRSVFLQDANTMVIKPDNMVKILSHIRESFPQVERITSYARSHSIARISDENMTRVARAGLNRIHIGMESGADEVLEFMKKGVNKEKHIIAGQKVKRAGIELSEYYMPGLGGQKKWKENAIETADALNQIDPDFIRIRTLAIPNQTELFQDLKKGIFEKNGDIQMAKELLLFIENLGRISGTIKSDHFLNLFQEVDGRLPDEKEQIMAPIKTFLSMSPKDQVTYLVGRRTGVFSGVEDMNNSSLRQGVEERCLSHHITPDNVEYYTYEAMKRFI